MSKPDSECIELDIRGQICPSCLLITLKEINQRVSELKAGSLQLRIVSDDRQATATIPEAVRNMGLSIAVSKEDGLYHMVVGDELTPD